MRSGPDEPSCFQIPVFVSTGYMHGVGSQSGHFEVKGSKGKQPNCLKT